MEILLKVIIFAPPVLFSIILHEVMHGYVAYLLGDPTAKNQGRITLNPIKHIDPVGTVVLPLILIIISRGGFLFGWAKPVPVNIYNTRNPKQALGLTALAGPLTNLALAIISAVLIRTFDYLPEIYEFVRFGYSKNPIPPLLFATLAINVGLVVLNMLPIPPLDGGRVIVWLLPDKQAIAYSAIEPYGMFIILFLLVFNPFGFFDKLALILFKLLLGF